MHIFMMYSYIKITFQLKNAKWNYLIVSKLNMHQ